MKVFLGTSLGIAVVALAISLLLIPRNAELALIDFKDKRYHVAMQSYQSMWDAGTRSISVLIPLSTLYLQNADVDGAVDLMEQYVEEHPDSLEAITMLGRYYQYAQRSHEYVRILSVLAQRHPTESTLRDLSRSYNDAGEYDKQIHTLKALIEHSPKHPKDFLDLAFLQAAKGHAHDALATIHQLEQQHPQAMTTTSTELKVSLALDTDVREVAAQSASNWLTHTSDADTIVRLVSLFYTRQEFSIANDLLSPFDSLLEQHSDLLQLWVELKIMLGDSATAFARLQSLSAVNRLSDDLSASHIELALSQATIAETLALAEHTDLSALPRWLLQNLADVAMATHREEFATHLVASLGDEFLVDRPVLAARIAVAQGDGAMAQRWITRAEDEALSLEEALHLMTLYRILNQDDDARRVLLALEIDDSADASILTEIASLHMLLGTTKEGLTQFEELRTHYRSEAIDVAWALLAAANGQQHNVVVWLRKTNINTLPHSVVVDLYHTAYDRSQATLALMTAQSIARRGIHPKRLLYLAHALILAKKPDKALTLVRSLLPGGRDEDDAYRAALTAAWKQGMPVTDELRTYWVSTLNTHRRERFTNDDVDAVYALIELDAHEETLPALRYFARDRGGNWTFAYEEALEKGGHDNELISFWVWRAEQDSTSAQEKRDIAFRLLAKGHQSEAEHLFVALAQDQPPQSPDVSQLLYIWGPRPHDEQLDWLEARAVGAMGKDRALWINHLMNVGAADRVVVWLKGIWPPPDRDPELVVAFATALVETKDHPTLRTLLEEEIPHEHDPERLRHLARLAYHSDHSEVAARAFTKIHHAKPHDLETLQWLGEFTASKGRYTEAKYYFEQALHVGSLTPEQRHTYGAMLQRDGDIDAANKQFHAALDQLSHDVQPTYTSQSIRAKLLHRLGQSDTAIALYEDLLSTQETNLHLRADFVEVLLDSKHYAEARKILSMTH